MLGAVLVCAAVTCAWAGKEFNFKDPKSVNAMTFMLDSVVEPITGIAGGVSGTIDFDPAKPEATTGKIVVESKSLHCENKGMKSKLHEPEWMDVEQYPTIEFSIKKTKVVKAADGVFDVEFTGDFKCRDKTKELVIPAKLTHLPDKLGMRMRGAEGDLLVVRSQFSIERKDFNIKPDMDNTVVAEKIVITANIAGAWPKK
jgi:polyisoprenoid-binding protein YceI